MMLNYSLSVEKGGTEVGTSLFKTRFFRTFIIEVIFNSIHCPPTVDYVFEINQLDKKMKLSINTILSTLMIFRIYLVLRLFGHYTK